MEKGNNEKNTTGCLIVFLIAFLLIFLPILIGMIANNINTSNQAKHEMKLIEEGKVKTHNEVINEIVEILKNRDEKKLEEYLADDFIYYKSKENIENKYVNYFFNDLDVLVSNFEIENTQDAIGDNEAYEIYWNVIEKNKEYGIDKNSNYYCLQKIRIILEKVVKEEITYEIERIILF